MDNNNETEINSPKEKTFIIKKDDDMYDIFINLWRLLAGVPWNDYEAQKLLKDFQSRLPNMGMYWDALDLAKEFTEKIGFKLVKEELKNN